MASRLKEDARNERTVRTLHKLPENRRCINCNSLGPQYVCTNFWTFVCTTCSGIHREFTHRVKSISMAKFTSLEVSALQGGGNASAKEIYLKEWDPQKHSRPDSSNVEKLRDFIKHVYVDKRYTGERSFDKPPRGKMGEMDNSNGHRRSGSYQGGSRSPPYEDTHEHRYSDAASPGGRSSGGRSPGYDQDNLQQGNNRKTPAQTEVINDWRREDRFGNGKRFENGRLSDGGSKPEDRSPDHQKDPEMSSPPILRPVRDILGDNPTPLRVIEPPTANSARSADGFVCTQRTASSSSLASSNGPAEMKTETSLIDFDAVTEPPAIASASQTHIAQQTTPSVADNWANFGSVTEVKVAQAPSKANSLGSLLELSDTASVPAHSGETSVSGGASVAAPASNFWDFPSSDSTAAFVVSPFSSVPATPPMSHSMAIPPGSAPTVVPPAPASLLPVGGGNSYVNSANTRQWSNMQSQQPAFPGTGNITIPQSFTPAAGGPPTNQPWNAFSSQGPLHAPVAQASARAATNPALETTPGDMTNPPSAGGRTELPEDLFGAPVYGWHTGPSHGFGFNMQYQMQMPTPAVLQRSKSTNPFDVDDEQPPLQASPFPSMASLQSALPNMAAQTGLLRTSSLGTLPSTWTAPRPSHLSTVPHQAPFYPSAILPSAYLGQQAPSNTLLRPQGAAGFGLEGSAFGTQNPHQPLDGLYSAPATQNTLSFGGGNPFG